MAREKNMTPTDIRQRAATAAAHLQVAEESFAYTSGSMEPSADAQVSASNSILAGIAAADAICGKALGRCSTGQDHRAAEALLATVMPDGAEMAVRLGRLQSDKSQLQYGTFCTPASAEKMIRNARALVASMTAVHHISVQ